MVSRPHATNRPSAESASFVERFSTTSQATNCLSLSESISLNQLVELSRQPPIAIRLAASATAALLTGSSETLNCFVNAPDVTSRYCNQPSPVTCTSVVLSARNLMGSISLNPFSFPGRYRAVPNRATTPGGSRFPSTSKPRLAAYLPATSDGALGDCELSWAAGLAETEFGFNRAGSIGFSNGSC